MLKSIGKSIWANAKSFPRDLSLSATFAGLLIVVVSCTGPIAIMLQAARAGHLTDAQTSSWLAVSWIGGGLFGIFLSLWLRIPIIGAWSTPTVALLVVGLTTHTLPEAVGAYFIASLLIILVGVTGIFDRILQAVPRPVIMAMLAGILFDFGIAIFRELPSAPIIVVAMLFGYFLARRMKWRAPVITSFAVALPIAILMHRLNHQKLTFTVVHPVWMNPSFSLGAFVTLALPIVLLTLTSQYAPGMAVLKSYGYPEPTNKSIITGGVISLASAGFLGSGVNSAAITAAIGAGDHAEPDKNRRYTAGVVCGLFYILVGICGSTMLHAFAVLPLAMVAAMGGLGLLPAIASSTADAFADPNYREAAMITLLVTVSNIHPWGLGAPFWGLVAGVSAHQIASWSKSKD